MPAAAAIGIIGTVAGTIFGAKAAGKQRQVAEQQQAAAQAAAQPTPREINAIEENLKFSRNIIAREEKVIAAVDPAILEAGKQAFELLQGKEAAILGPARRQRDRQRNRLRESLRRRLGAGFETSSAGIQALTQFDVETSDFLTTQQFKATGQLLGVAERAASRSRESERGAGQIRASAIQSLGAISERQVSAITGTTAGITAAAGGKERAIAGGFGALATIGAAAAKGA